LATTVRARELLAAFGVERYGLQVKRIAAILDKPPVTGSTWVMRGIQSRKNDPKYRKLYEWLDSELAID